MFTGAVRVANPSAADRFFHKGLLDTCPLIFGPSGSVCLLESASVLRHVAAQLERRLVDRGAEASGRRR
jgi:hypothetical protein